MDNDEALPTNEYPDLVQRLRAFGTAPLEPGLAARCWDRVRGNGRPTRRGVSSKWLVAATLAGFAAGSVGLAAADVLPAPVQDVAHTTLDRVGVHVPPGHDRYNDPKACPGGPYRNHGAYVRSHKNDPAAGKSPCGKPVKSVEHSDSAKTDDKADDSDTGHGPPPWAHGKGSKDKKSKKTTEAGDDKTAPTTLPSKSTTPTSSSTSTSTSSTPSTTSSTSTTTTSLP